PLLSGDQFITFLTTVSVQVALRIRPINEAELEEGASIIAHRVGDQMVVLMDPSEDPDDILRANRSREKTFIFDMVFDQKATQEEVYVSTTKSLVGGVISGYNATVFAYGPTGAGKTYTMLGMDCEPGIYIRTLNDLFRALEATSDSMDYTVSMSYLEIYNEVIRDLLNPSSGFLDLREDSRGSIQIAGITEVSTTNAQEIMQLLTKGNKERTQEPTAANKTSSRSHAVLQVTVKRMSRVKDITEEARVGRLFMVDLAGSERAAQTQNRGKRMKEGAHINRSLLALGNCINALSEKGGSRGQYVNFRDSKLTRLLKDSLGGNSRTVMIAHISPASMYFEESRTTLIYAYRAKNIKTRVKRNLLNVSYHIAQYTSIISDLRREIERLKAKIENQEKEKSQSRGCLLVNIGLQASSRQEMNKLREQLIGAFKEQLEMRRSLIELENTNVELHIDASRHLLTITECHDKSVNEKEDETMDEEDREAEGTDSPEPHEVMVAREEINMLLAEQRKTAALKAELEKRLANAKKKASQMEKLLPRQITSKDQQEVLRLLCKAHELEVGNTELQASALYKENLLCQKDFVIQRLQQHRLLCEEIIQQQQMLIRGKAPALLSLCWHCWALLMPNGESCKSTGVAAGKIPELNSPTSLGLTRKKSAVDIMTSPLSPEALKEIAVSTKSISLIAARRRCRAQTRDHGSEPISAHFFEDDMVEPKYLKASSTPEPRVKGRGSFGSLPEEPQREKRLHPKTGRELRKERDREKSAERKARKKRSRSLEHSSQRVGDLYVSSSGGNWQGGKYAGCGWVERWSECCYGRG
uniref:Kinesin-like protein n=1 Tax=Crocodylus porosus TaxID=8502 RepID=A0A7M4FEF0_CROPO